MTASAIDVRHHVAINKKEGEMHSTPVQRGIQRRTLNSNDIRNHANIKSKQREIPVIKFAREQSSRNPSTRQSVNRLGMIESEETSYYSSFDKIGVTGMQSNNNPENMPSAQRLPCIVVNGGDISALTTVLLLLEYGHRRRLSFNIHLYEPRWIKEDDKLYWSPEEDLNNRRSRVVTVQASLWDIFPAYVKQTLSAFHILPKEPAAADEDINVTISFLEDVFLEIIQNQAARMLRTATGEDDPENVQAPRLKLYGEHKGRLDNTKLQKIVHDEGGIDFLILTDNDAVQELCPTLFTKPVPYPEDPSEKLTEHILGIYFDSEDSEQSAPTLNQSERTALSLSQNRFVIHSLGPTSGVIHMWLTSEEIEEVTAMDANMSMADNRCHACMFSRTSAGDTNFRCGHDSYFTPCLPFAKRFSKLWPRIKDALAMWGIPEDSVAAFTKFCDGPFSRRMDFVAAMIGTIADKHLHSTFNARQAPFAFLVGDAAFPLSVRAVHGVNSTLKGAVSLARCLTRALERGAWGLPDFVPYNGLVYSLQERDVRINSLHAMQGREEDSGAHFTIVGKIKEGMALYTTVKSSENDLGFMRALLNRRLRDIIDTDSDGHLSPDNAHESYDKLETHMKIASDETICILAKSGARLRPPLYWSELTVGDHIPEPQWAEKTIRN